LCPFLAASRKRLREVALKLGVPYRRLIEASGKPLRGATTKPSTTKNWSAKRSSEFSVSKTNAAAKGPRLATC
ncbi:MAG: hypothetical protein SFV81_09260, partial [Pirellulaceae bacterium]|nr:hypothetical protein [Pirellulaceae bacterium]